MLRRAVGKALQRGASEVDPSQVETLRAQVSELEGLARELTREVQDLRAELARLKGTAR